MQLCCRGSKECKQCSFCAIMNVLMAKLCPVFLFFCHGFFEFLSVCVKQRVRERKREREGDLGSLHHGFQEKQHLYPLQSRSFMFSPSFLCVSLSPLYSFVSVCQPDCLTITALIKLSEDEKSSLQSAQKQANRCESKHMSIRDIITKPLAEVGTVTVDPIDGQTYTHAHTNTTYTHALFHMHALSCTKASMCTQTQELDV